MSEAEFEQLLDVVRATVQPGLSDHELASSIVFHDVPVAANDNDGAWPLLPFPDGWTASC